MATIVPQDNTNRMQPIQDAINQRNQQQAQIANIAAHAKIQDLMKTLDRQRQGVAIDSIMPGQGQMMANMPADVRTTHMKEQYAIPQREAMGQFLARQNGNPQQMVADAMQGGQPGQDTGMTASQPTGMPSRQQTGMPSDQEIAAMLSKMPVNQQIPLMNMLQNQRNSDRDFLLSVAKAQNQGRSVDVKEQAAIVKENAPYVNAITKNTPLWEAQLKKLQNAKKLWESGKVAHSQSETGFNLSKLSSYSPETQEFFTDIGESLDIGSQAEGTAPTDFRLQFKAKNKPSIFQSPTAQKYALDSAIDKVAHNLAGAHMMDNIIKENDYLQPKSLSTRVHQAFKDLKYSGKKALDVLNEMERPEGTTEQQAQQGQPTQPNMPGQPPQQDPSIMQGQMPNQEQQGTNFADSMPTGMQIANEVVPAIARAGEEVYGIPEQAREFYKSMPSMNPAYEAVRNIPYVGDYIKGVEGTVIDYLMPVPQKAELRKYFNEKSGGLTENKTVTGKHITDAIGTAVGGAIATAAAGGSVPTALKGTVIGKLARWGAEYLDAPEWLQNGADITGNLLGTVKFVRPTMEAIKKLGYGSSDEKLATVTSNPRQYTNTAKSLKKEMPTIKGPDEKALVDALDDIIAQTEGKSEVPGTFWTTEDKAIGNLKNRVPKKYWHIVDGLQETIDRNLDRLSKISDTAAKGVMDYKEARSAAAGLASGEDFSKFATDAFKKYGSKAAIGAAGSSLFGIGNALLFNPAHSIMGAATVGGTTAALGAAGTAGKMAYSVINAMSRSDVAKHLYEKAFEAYGKDNTSSFVKYATQLDKVLEKLI